MRCLDGIINSMDMNLNKVQEKVKGREANYVTVHGSQRLEHDRATEEEQVPGQIPRIQYFKGA